MMLPHFQGVRLFTDPAGGGSMSHPGHGNAASPADVGTTPSPRFLEATAFEEAAAAGKLLAVHTDLFVHPFVARKHAMSPQALQQAMAEGASAACAWCTWRNVVQVWLLWPHAMHASAPVEPDAP